MKRKSGSVLQENSGPQGNEGENADGSPTKIKRTMSMRCLLMMMRCTRTMQPTPLMPVPTNLVPFEAPAQWEKRCSLLASTTYTKARKEFPSLSEGLPIEKVKRVANRVSDASLSRAIELLLHADNAQNIAWGTKCLRAGA